MTLLRKKLFQGLFLHFQKKSGEYRAGIITEKSEKIIEIILKIFDKNPFKGLALLIVLGVVSQDSKEISKFLYDSKVNPVALGLLISEPFSFFCRILEDMMKVISFNRANLIVSLRKLFKVVKLPVDRNQANRIIRAFAKEF